MKKTQFGIAALLTATAWCALAFAALRAADIVLPIAMFVVLLAGPILALVSVATDWRAMSQQAQIRNLVLLAILVLTILAAGFLVH